ncbi:non-canonical purine NTP diphosphatase [Porphyromonadaceae bacterium]
MKQIVFATNNDHKLEEVRAILSNKYDILSLKEIGCDEEIEETGTTLEANALIKARYVKERYGYDCFADDTGLEVEALNGAPGVYSARYAGEEKSSMSNMKRLLSELEGVENRKARFRTVIAWVDDKGERLHEGEVCGTIVDTLRGTRGFGYDPIFVPEGFDNTFAELSAETKNAISHRGRAVQKLVEWLENKD